LNNIVDDGTKVSTVQPEEAMAVNVVDVGSRCFPPASGGFAF
jgi:hypothetical protein